MMVREFRSAMKANHPEVEVSVQMEYPIVDLLIGDRRRYAMLNVSRALIRDVPADDADQLCRVLVDDLYDVLAKGAEDDV